MYGIARCLSFIIFHVCRYLCVSGKGGVAWEIVSGTQKVECNRNTRWGGLGDRNRKTTTVAVIHDGTVCVTQGVFFFQVARPLLTLRVVSDGRFGAPNFDNVYAHPYLGSSSFPFLAR